MWLSSVDFTQFGLGLLFQVSPHTKQKRICQGRTEPERRPAYSSLNKTLFALSLIAKALAVLE